MSEEHSELPEGEARENVRKWSAIYKDGELRASDNFAKSVSIGDLEWLEKLHDAANTMRQHYRNTGEGQWENVIANIASLTSDWNNIHSDIQKCQKRGQLGGTDEYGDTIPTYKWTREFCKAPGGWSNVKRVNEVWQWAWSDENKEKIPDSQLPKASSKNNCGWIQPEQSPDKYNISSLINDITACFHRTVEHYRDSATKFHHEGKCSWWE